MSTSSILVRALSHLYLCYRIITIFVGAKQGTGETIDSVLLPPWANGDPKIFIQRHREVQC